MLVISGIVARCGIVRIAVAVHRLIHRGGCRLDGCDGRMGHVDDQLGQAQRQQGHQGDTPAKWTDSLAYRIESHAVVDEGRSFRAKPVVYAHTGAACNPPRLDGSTTLITGTTATLAVAPARR